MFVLGSYRFININAESNPVTQQPTSSLIRIVLWRSSIHRKEENYYLLSKKSSKSRNDSITTAAEACDQYQKHRFCFTLSAPPLKVNRKVHRWATSVRNNHEQTQDSRAWLRVSTKAEPVEKRPVPRYSRPNAMRQVGVITWVWDSLLGSECFAIFGFVIFGQSFDVLVAAMRFCSETCRSRSSLILRRLIRSLSVSGWISTACP